MGWKQYRWRSLSRLLVLHRDRVPHHAHRRHPAEMVPDGGGDDAAGPHHAAHLRDGLVGLGDEMEHQEREGAVEPAVRERNGAGIALARS